MIARHRIFFEGDAGGASGGGEGGGSTTLLSGQQGGGQQQQQSSAAPAFAWAKEDGTLDTGWIEKLPEGLRGEASLRSISTLPDLAKSYVETKRLIGTKLEMPGEKATPEQIASWRKTVGAPEKPEGYLGDAKTLRPEAVPENLWNAESEKAFLALAHRHHLPPAAVKEIIGFHADSIAAALAKSSEDEGAVLQAEGTKLRTAWGQDYDANLNIALRVAETAGFKKDDPIFTNANVVQGFAKLGKLLSEDKLVKGDAPSMAQTLADRARDITDPKSQGQVAREYRGEFGPERQTAAQQLLHSLYNTSKAA